MCFFLYQVHYFYKVISFNLNYHSAVFFDQLNGNFSKCFFNKVIFYLYGILCLTKEVYDMSSDEFRIIKDKSVSCQGMQAFFPECQDRACLKTSLPP